MLDRGNIIPTIAKIEGYVARNIEYIDLIVKQVCSLLPNSYFYKSEIEKGEFLLLRREMRELERGMNSSSFSKHIDFGKDFVLKQREFEEKLSKLVIQKRQQLLDELLEETLEMKVSCVISLIFEYRLLKMLRTFC